MQRLEQEARRAMRDASTYAQWREAATAFDKFHGFDDWKLEDASNDYDWRLIRGRLREIRKLRRDGAVIALVYHLRQGLHWNLGNLSNPALYSHALVGTKHLVEDYVREVCAALNHLCDKQHASFGGAEKLQFFRETSAWFGRSALMLSGGATLGLFHLGVVKALVGEDLLPHVISGSSAGSVVAAAIGTRSPEEIGSLLDASKASFDFWKLLELRQMWRQRVLMDQRQVRQGIASNIVDLTFDEAYRRSGRIINVTVTPAGVNHTPRLLNYLSAPHLYVREAVLASSAVPFVFAPVMLKTRDAAGRRVPYLPSLRWTDGSLKSDLPIQRLRRLHNINHFVVSQTNPHVIPFLERMEDQGAANNLRRALYKSFFTSAQSMIKIGQVSVPSQMLRRYFDTASAIIDQDYHGNVTILPKVSLWRYAKVTANPTVGDVERFILEGERATWRRIEMVRNQMQVSQTLTRCLQRLEGSTQIAAAA